jgi:putative transposase
MTSYRRLRIPGATYFFTVFLEDRERTTLVDEIGSLRDAYRRTVTELPVLCQAMVILPNRLHAIWTEPQGECRFSERWRRIKGRFSHSLGPAEVICASKRAKREAGIWQRRFWEHCIRNEAEFLAAMAYCRMNPVKHGLVQDPEDWPYSSFTRRMGNIAHPTDQATL